MKFGKLLGAAVLLILLINKIPSSLAQADLEIKLKNRSFVPQTRGTMRAEGRSGGGRQHMILQFAEMPDVETLAQYDIQPLNYIPDNAIMASVPAGFDQRNAPGVHWMGQLLASDKISADVSKRFETMAADQQLTLVVEAHPDVDSQTLASLAARAGGAFDTHPDLPGHVGLVTGAPDMFQQLASDKRISWIMAASDGLVNGEPIYYCPGPITEFGPIANYVVHDDGWDGPGLGSASLTYHFLNGTSDIGGSGEEGAVRDALATWSNYADLTFSETNTAGSTRSLDILWAVGSHGDPYPFDGPGGVLAHAFFPSPPNSEPLAGDMHFDDSEDWSLTADFHMFAVALHEAGHSLGLGHSDVPGAVMYAYYGGPVSDLEPDDIAGIRAIYSYSGNNAPSTPALNSISNPDGDGSYTISWSNVADATSYELQEQQDGGVWSTIYDGSSTSQNVNGRNPGEWCYQVRASNSAGSSAWSGKQCATVTELAPDPPVLNSISNGDGDGSFTVSWSSVANATSYDLQEQYNGGPWSTIYNGSNTSQNFNGRSAGEWCYQVRASNSGGSSAWSNKQCATVTEPAPDAPILNSISNSDGDGSFTVSWSGVSSATSYELQEQYDSGLWSTIYDGSGISQNINGRSPGEWCYRVRASNSGGSSAWSGTQCATVTELAPDTPVLNSISNSDGDGSFAVSWSSVANATGYDLQEQFNGGLWSSVYNGSGTSQNISGRSPGEYCYRVQASNSGGSSAWSGTQCATVTEPAPDAPVLNSISNSDGDGSFVVSWSGVANATSYNLHEQHDGGLWGSVYNGSGTSQTIIGRSAGAWCYRVQASNSSGSSAWSGTQCASVSEPAPDAPFLNSIYNADGDGTYTVHWSTVTNVTSYELQEQQNGGVWSTIYGGSSTTHNVNDRSTGEWCYRVRGSNSEGTSAWSSTQCATVALTPTVQFTQTHYSVDEGAGSVEIGVSLNMSTEKTITVKYETRNDGAVAGADYVYTSEMLTFSPGDTELTFTVSILDDASIEPEESVQMTLSGPTNAELGFPATATLTIQDNDAQPCYVLTLEHLGSGSNLVAQPTHSPECPEGQYSAGYDIDLSAAPASGWYVSAWINTNNDASTDHFNTVTMPAQNHTVTVHYNLIATNYAFIPSVANW